MTKWKANTWITYGNNRRVAMITNNGTPAPEENSSENFYHTTAGLIGDDSGIQAWKAVRGELCVFWDNDSYYVIDEYVWSKNDNGLNPKRFVANSSDRSYHNMAPLKYAYYIAAELGVYCD